MTGAELMAGFYRALIPPADLTVSDWADRNRRLTSESSSSPGPWRTDKAPFQREIMNAFTQNRVWKIVVMSSAQIGKTEMVLNMIGRTIDVDPGPILYVMPTKEFLRDFMVRRVRPMFRACDVLKRKVYDEKTKDDTDSVQMTTFVGGSLALTGANSSAELRSRPIKDLFLDEVDVFPGDVGGEGDPVMLAEKRTETFRYSGRKEALLSTPTTAGKSRIEAAYLEGTQEEWRTRCSRCGKFSYILFDDIQFEREAYDANGKKAYRVWSERWKCPKCGAEMEEHEVKRAESRWEATNPDAIQNGIRSFRLNAFTSPWSSWHEICAEFLEVKDFPDRLKAFRNVTLGELWRENVAGGEPERLFARRENYGEETEVPEGVLVLTCAIDTQDNRFEYEVRGWDRTGQSWGIEYGKIYGRPDTEGPWEEIDRLLKQRFIHESGAEMRIARTFIDSGGHFTQAVYQACSRRQKAGMKIYAIKGEDGENRELCKAMSTTKKGGDIRFVIGVDSCKEAVMYGTTVTEIGPMYMHWTKKHTAGYDLDYFYGLISEHLVPKKSRGGTVMIWEKFRDRNEPLDLCGYNYACFRFFKWPFDEYERVLKGIEDERPTVETREAVERKKNRHVVSRGISV